MDRRELPSMAVFVAVAEGLSFALAARRLGVNASSVSRSVASLERRLGVRLFRRTSRSVVLTYEGQMLFERCRDAFDRIDEALEQLSGLRESVRGLLRVTMPLGVGRKYLLPALPGLLRRHPELRVETITTDRLIDVVQENVDVAVRVGDLTPSSLRATRICESVFTCIGSPAYFEQRGTPQTPDELNGHTCIAFRLPNGLPRRWLFRSDDTNGRVGYDPPATLIIDDGPALVAAVVDGFGLGYVPDYLARDELESGRVVRVLKAYSTPAGAIHCVYTQRLENALRARVFVDFVRDCMGGASVQP